MTEFGFPRASDEMLAIRNELADQVIQTLHHAGLPAFRESDPDTDDRGGAVIHVDFDAEIFSSAVSVVWRCDAVPLHAAVVDITSGNTDTPTARYPGSIGLQMQAPLMKILLTAGFIATPTNDAMDPTTVLVFGRTSDLPPALRPTSE
ncbi:hypothetical protein [Streptomyces sp. NPDC048272]|uniref:hypothetical protein n=1 Tax=Streptomyces sp. NPDC048272 TaxID=3154616 RepID=UPI003447193A